jgi:hypothetical protein
MLFQVDIKGKSQTLKIRVDMMSIICRILSFQLKHIFGVATKVQLYRFRYNLEVLVQCGTFVKFLVQSKF